MKSWLTSALILLALAGAAYLCAITRESIARDNAAKACTEEGLRPGSPECKLYLAAEGYDWDGPFTCGFRDC